MQRDPLVTIGVHGSKHRILTECTPEEQAEEIFASKQVLEKLLGQTCDLFAIPTGSVTTISANSQPLQATARPSPWRAGR